MNLTISNHAVQRYIERVKPAIEFKQAAEELAALVRAAGEPNGIPEWIRPEHLPPSDCWLEISDGIAAAVSEDTVATVLIRSTSSSEHRANKNASKAKRRAARQAQRRATRRFKGTDKKVIWR